jgi:hypothetical protein
MPEPDQDRCSPEFPMGVSPQAAEDWPQSSVYVITLRAHRVASEDTPNLEVPVSQEAFGQGVRTGNQRTGQIDFGRDAPGMILRPEQVRRLQDKASARQIPSKVGGGFQWPLEQEVIAVGKVYARCIPHSHAEDR